MIKLRYLATEAWRNFTSRTSRPLLTTLLLLSVLSGAAFLEAISVTQQEHQASLFRRHMSNVLVLDASGQIDGTACDRLSRNPGIPKSGAIRATARTVRPSSTPQVQVPLYEASDHFGRLLGVDLRRGVAADRTSAHLYGLVPGGVWSSGLGPLPIAGSYSYPEDGRNAELQYAVLAHGSARQPFDQCWIETWPFDPAKASILFSTLAPSASSEQAENASVVQLNPSDGARLDARRAFETRPTRWLWVLAFVVGFLIVVGLTRLRRLELSTFVHLGGNRRDVATLLLIETGLCVAFTAGAAAIGAVAALQLGVLTPDASRYGLRVLASGLLGSCIGAAASAVVVRERTLFAHFKQQA